jgi:DNA polymerase-3 subunit gamma/tau
MGREKVYIIDEAQRLTGPAFDALLKLFEEPPPGVRFVLATTEPQKMPATIVGRCQRFDFRRLSLEQLAEHLMSVAKSESVELSASAAHTIARQAEGSARDALSLLDQASVLGGAEVGDEVIAALLGAPRAEVQHELADAVAVGDAKAVFEIVNRLVMDGHDLRNVTAETLSHFRNLLLVQTAPGQPELLDVAADEFEHLRAQAAKFSAAELARVIELLLAAQNDMRWTTSPRLSLELALVRATLPENDPAPAGLLARLERLERLANLDAGSAPQASSAGATAAATATGREGGAEGPPAATSAMKSRTKATETETPETAAQQQAEDTPPAAAEAPTAPDASNVDVAMLRRSWPALLDHLQTMRQPILKALLESATVATFDGTTLELAFPPDKKFGVTKVIDRGDELREALGSLFGIRPELRCVVREAGSGVVVVEEDEVPDDAEALRRVQEMLGAQVAGDTEE